MKDHDTDTMACLRELTNVDIECDSAESKSEHSSLRSLLSQFIENEARSCSMDYGCITPEYVYRMFGGKLSMEYIENGLRELRKQGFLEL